MPFHNSLKLSFFVSFWTLNYQMSYERFYCINFNDHHQRLRKHKKQFFFSSEFGSNGAFIRTFIFDFNADVVERWNPIFKLIQANRIYWTNQHSWGFLNNSQLKHPIWIQSMAHCLQQGFVSFILTPNRQTPKISHFESKSTSFCSASPKDYPLENNPKIHSPNINYNCNKTIHSRAIISRIRLTTVPAVERNKSVYHIHFAITAHFQITHSAKKKTRGKNPPASQHTTTRHSNSI